MRRLLVKLAYAVLIAGYLVPAFYLNDALNDLKISEKALGRCIARGGVLNMANVKSMMPDEWDIIHLKSRDNSMEAFLFNTKE